MKSGCRHNLHIDVNYRLRIQLSDDFAVMSSHPATSSQEPLVKRARSSQADGDVVVGSDSDIGEADDADDPAAATDAETEAVGEPAATSQTKTTCLDDLFGWHHWGFQQLVKSDPATLTTFKDNAAGLVFESHYSGIGFHEASLTPIFNACRADGVDVELPHAHAAADISAECRKVLCEHACGPSHVFGEMDDKVLLTTKVKLDAIDFQMDTKQLKATKKIMRRCTGHKKALKAALHRMHMKLGHRRLALYMDVLLKTDVSPFKATTHCYKCDKDRVAPDCCCSAPTQFANACDHHTHIQTCINTNIISYIIPCACIRACMRVRVRVRVRVCLCASVRECECVCVCE